MSTPTPTPSWFDRRVAKAVKSLPIAQEVPTTRWFQWLTVIDALAPGWETLRHLGKSRTIRSSYFWMIFVPIVAKLLHPLPEHFEFLGFKEFTPALPFSWVIFFWMALAFSAASLLFSLRCPAIIRQFANFKDFADERHGELRLHLDFYRLVRLPETSRWGIQPYKRLFQDIGMRKRNGNFGDHELVAMQSKRQFDLIYKLDIPETSRPEAFELIRFYSDRLHPFSRLICAVLYAIGFALAAWILLQNVAAVVELAR